MGKRTILFALMIPLLLAGCAAGGQDETEFKRWQEELSAASGITFSAEITSQGERDAVTFTADVRRAEESTVLTVTAPETIRGVTVSAGAAGAALEYDGLVLALDALREDALAPCAAGSILLDAITAGHLLWTGRAAEYRTAALTAPGGETVTLWRDEDGRVVYAEIAREEQTELILRITNWQAGA